jgi:hypothetical protein
MQYTIKATGEGTSIEIINALRSLILNIEDDIRKAEDENIGTIEFDGGVLYTEIKEKEPTTKSA